MSRFKTTIYERVNINEISNNLPNLKEYKDMKTLTIGKWLINTIKTNKVMKPNKLLPSKSDLAYMLGVSQGTVQHAIKYVEDLGYLTSKQSIGTIIKDRENNSNTFRKMTSKRDVNINLLKKYLLANKYKVGDVLPIVNELAQELDVSPSNIRSALQNLQTIGILECKCSSYRKHVWIVKSVNFKTDEFENSTLEEKVSDDITDYINKNLKVGDTIPTHHEFAKLLSVSVKTVHDAIQTLVNKGILNTRRGRYGTVVSRMPNNEQRYEFSIFASSTEAAFYHYEKTREYLKNMIAQNYEIGQKFLSISQLSESLDISTNTVRKAILELVNDGYLTLKRGRYGGTFVKDIPEIHGQTFKWLAVSPEYSEMYSN